MKNKGYNFLLVGDSKSSRFLVQRMIKNSEISIDKIFIAENGKEALKILFSKEVDIILTDIVMPVMDGITLINEVKKSKYSHIPIIPVSSLGSKKELELFSNHDIDVYIIKTVTQEKINKILKNALNLN